MESKKLGFLIIGISIVVGFIMFSFMVNLNTQGEVLQCNPSDECQQVNSLLGLSHIAVGFISFIFALGFYLLFFNKGEEAILKRLEEEKDNKVQENLFSVALKMLDDNEKNVINAIKEQDGITQTTLRYRTDLSKAKISQILTDFEKKSLIKRIQKGKTYSVHLIQSF